MEEKNNNQERDEIYANAVRAGKRTYFFDVRATKGNDYYLTITESKRRYNDDGTFHYQKHKLFLYKEDFEKFGDAFTDALEKITELQEANPQEEKSEKITNNENYTDVSFDELGTEK